MIRTLIVDDDFAVAGMHRRFVEALDGFEVAGVLARGQPVLEFLEQHEEDLVLLDVRMPGESGLALFERLTELGRLDALPVVFLTGHGDVPTAVAAVKQGADK